MTAVVVVVVDVVSHRRLFFDARSDFREGSAARVRESFALEPLAEAPKDRVVEAWSDPGGHDRNERRLRTEYSGAAEWTVSMRPQPDIDAINVKSMRTHRKRADVIVVLEFQQANRTVTAFTVRFRGVVQSKRNRLDHRLIEPVRRAHVESIGRLEKRRVERQRIQVSRRRRQVRPSSTSATAPPFVAAEDAEDRRDDVAGDES